MLLSCLSQTAIVMLGGEMDGLQVYPHPRPWRPHPHPRPLLFPQLDLQTRSHFPQQSRGGLYRSIHLELLRACPKLPSQLGVKG